MAPSYQLLSNGGCAQQLRTKSDCEVAAAQLGLASTIATRVHRASTYQPSQCSFIGDSLYFAPNAIFAEPCSSSKQCLCLRPDEQFQPSPRDSSCVDSPLWFYHNTSFDCAWFAAHDPGCTRYPNRNQHEACRVTCGTCPPDGPPTSIDAPGWQRLASSGYTLSFRSLRGGVATHEPVSCSTLGATGCVKHPGYSTPRVPTNFVPYKRQLTCVAGVGCTHHYPRSSASAQQPAGQYDSSTVTTTGWNLKLNQNPVSDPSNNMAIGGLGQIHWADVNNDGHLDALAGSKMYFNNGHGRMCNYGTPEYPGTQAAFVDLNNDGWIDLLTPYVRIGTTSTRIWMNKGAAGLNMTAPDGPHCTYDQMALADMAALHQDVQRDFDRVVVHAEPPCQGPWGSYTNIGRCGSVYDNNPYVLYDIKHIAIGDPNGDGWPDVFYSTGGLDDFLYQNVAGNLTRWTGTNLTDDTYRGTCSCSNSTDRRTCGYSGAAVFADFNNDGFDDFLQTCQFTFLADATGFEAINMVRFFYSDGNGNLVRDRTSWYAPMQFQFAPSGVAVADYDGDGFLDVYLGGVQELLHNRGTQGGFVGEFTYVPNPNDPDVNANPLWSRFKDYVPGESGGLGEAFGDVDGDGRLDLVGAGTTVMRNMGNGVFQASSVGPTGTHAYFLDLDSDGDTDLVTAEAVWENVHEGTWTAVTVGAFPDAVRSATYPLSVAEFGDVNNDGYLDLLSGAQRSALVYINDGTGELVFGPTGYYIDRTASCAAFGDFNNDGLLDLLLGTYTGRSPAKVRFNDGSEKGLEGTSPRFEGTINDATFAIHLDGGVDAVVTAVVAADFDNDGWLDAFLAGHGQDRLFMNDRAEGFMLNATLVSGRSNAACAGDVDGDGLIDLYVGAGDSVAEWPGGVSSPSYENSTMDNRIYLNDGLGNLVRVTNVAMGDELRGILNMSLADTGDPIDYIDGATYTNTESCAFLDFDKDGRLDLVVSHSACVTANGRPVRCPVNLFRNTGDSSNGMASLLSLVKTGDIWSTPGGGSVAVADFNNDGWDDLLVGGTLFRNVRGTLRHDADAGPGGNGYRFGDVDGDGVLDLVRPDALLLSKTCDAGVPIPITAQSSACSACPSSAVKANGRCVECNENIIVGALGQCSFSCPLGYVRPFGELGCDACLTGTKQAVGSTRCDACPAGTFSPVNGSVLCFDCSLGTFAGSTGMSACEACSPGKFSSSAGAAVCELCATGGYCPDAGASSALVFRQCSAGTYNEDRGSNSPSACRSCPFGKASPVPGSSHASVCKDCLPGGYASVNGTDVCTLCAPGKYQGDAGQTTCRPCTTGYLCVRGSSAPQPCPGGRHANQTVLQNDGFLSSLDQCVICPAGTFCSVGSEAPTDCAPGTFNDQLNASTCVNCVAGTFQAVAGSTACDECTPGCALPARPNALHCLCLYQPRC